MSSDLESVQTPDDNELKEERRNSNELVFPPPVIVINDGERVQTSRTVQPFESSQNPSMEESVELNKMVRIVTPEEQMRVEELDSSTPTPGWPSHMISMEDELEENNPRGYSLTNQMNSEDLFAMTPMDEEGDEVEKELYLDERDMMVSHQDDNEQRTHREMKLKQNLVDLVNTLEDAREKIAQLSQENRDLKRSKVDLEKKHLLAQVSKSEGLVVDLSQINRDSEDNTFLGGNGVWNGVVRQKFNIDDYLDGRTGKSKRLLGFLKSWRMVMNKFSFLKKDCESM